MNRFGDYSDEDIEATRWLMSLMCPSCDFDCRDPEVMIEHIKQHSTSGRLLM